MRNVLKFFEFRTITMREAVLELHKDFKVVLQKFSDAKVKFLWNAHPSSRFSGSIAMQKVGMICKNGSTYLLYVVNV